MKTNLTFFFYFKQTIHFLFFDAFALDILAENKIIIKLKSIDAIHPIYEAQILTYMKFAGIKTGLLINFNATKLKEGLKRFVF
ncbi:MAG: GxxExxY protein [Ignavibacteria bacterium]